jgi:voltage-gated potassium channel
MDLRRLLGLGLLLGIASGKPPEEWLGGAHDFLRDKQADDPMRTLLATVLLGSAAFYQAERGHNSKIRSYYDALVYVSTNLSVGYCDIFATTDAGKSIATTLMTYGPALAARALDPPREAATRAEEGERSHAALVDIADKLEQLLVELRQQRTANPAHG